MRKRWRKRGLAIVFAVGLAVWAAALTGAVDFGRAVSLW
jgi:hypothetical protein